MWLYPDGARILEVSTKCLPDEAFKVGAAFKDYLAQHGIALGAVQDAEDPDLAGLLRRHAAAEVAG